MNNLKIISVFIILIFCLSPLSAMDLNNTDNMTKSSPMAEGKTIEVEKLNITNDTSDKKCLNKNTASLANKKNKAKNSEELLDPDISVLADDIQVGENLDVFINANYKFNGGLLIKINDSSDTYFVRVKDGFAYKSIERDLPVGVYTVTATFSGNDEFKAGEASKRFRVKEKEYVPVDPKLRVNVNPITVGETALIEILTDQSLNGHVKVKLSISKYDYDVEVKNGYGQLEFTNLPIGTYSVKATYDGDDIFKSDEDTAVFEVRKEKELIDPNVSITVNDINEGEKVFTEIHTDEKYTGSVSVGIDDQPWVSSVKIENGYGNASLSRTLSPGEHTATVYFYETQTYCRSEKTTSFKVN